MEIPCRSIQFQSLYSKGLESNDILDTCNSFAWLHSKHAGTCAVASYHKTCCGVSDPMCLTAFPFDSVDFAATGRTSNCSTRLVENLRREDRTLISFLAL